MEPWTLFLVVESKETTKTQSYDTTTSTITRMQFLCRQRRDVTWSLYSIFSARMGLKQRPFEHALETSHKGLRAISFVSREI